MVEDAWKAGATMVLSKSSHSPKKIVESVRTALQAAGEQPNSIATPTTIGPSMPARHLPVSRQVRDIPIHVLLVEDQPDVRALISFLLDQAGHHVTSVFHTRFVGLRVTIWRYPQPIGSLAVRAAKGQLRS
jgi:DNA-binding NarL/FixJ family response regulator